MSSLHTPRSLDAALSYSAGRLDDDRWNDILDQFSDASVFQTIPFGVAKSQSMLLEHFVLRRGSDPVAAAQVRLIRVPLVGHSIAYVLWGPMWKHTHGRSGELVLGSALRALRHEYVVMRGLSLRVVPRLTKGESPDVWALFDQEGFGHVPSLKTNRTIVVDLRRSAEELRRGMDKKWRNCLNSAERNGLEVVEGSDQTMFELFLSMYRQMLARKRLAEPGDIRRFRAMQSLLPSRFRMNIIVALKGCEPCAGAILSAIGRSGLYLFGATADSGMKNKASYLVHWRAIQWLKEMGCTEYDLHGSNAQANPGVYEFKMALCGKNGKEVEGAGNFDAHPDSRSKWLTNVADRLNYEYKRMRTIYGIYRVVKG
jgi:lipid II:glycine glycyltransferase (peptidoglycan interpeptide bridge formation enzyme)